MERKSLWFCLVASTYIEMAALKAVGKRLEGSGWAQALVLAEIVTAGMADSFHKASHVMRTRRAHQITSAALYILKHRACDHYSLTCLRDNKSQLDFDTWCDNKKSNCSKFHYWSTVVELEVNFLTFVRSLREANFSMNLDALTELVLWFYALDHTNYVRWIPVHLRDMAELNKMHPDIYQEFKNGHFTAQKTKHIFFCNPH